MSPPASPKVKTTSSFATLTNLNRHPSHNKPSRLAHMPPPVRNEPVVNSPISSMVSSSKSPKNTPPKRQRRFSLQAVTARFSFGSSSSSLSTATIEEKDSSYSDSIVVDETALSKLCDVLPQVDREVLTKYLREAGGKDDLMAVGLYMRDFKNDNF